MRSCTYYQRHVNATFSPRSSYPDTHHWITKRVNKHDIACQLYSASIPEKPNKITMNYETHLSHNH